MGWTAGETWGVSNPVFVVGYVAAVVIAALAVMALRRALTRRARERELDPYEAAWLLGGESLAIGAAIAALRSDGAIAVADRLRRIRVNDPPPDSPPGLTRERVWSGSMDLAVETALRSARALGLWELPRRPEVKEALRDVRAGVERDGLARSRADVRRQRWALLPLWIVCAAGVAGLLAGAGPAALLIPALVLTALLAALGLRVSTLTKAGRRALADTRSRHAHLDPEQTPPRHTYDAPEAAMGAALYGPTVLARLDPKFVLETSARRHFGSPKWSGNGNWWLFEHSSGPEDAGRYHGGDYDSGHGPDSGDSGGGSGF